MNNNMYALLTLLDSIWRTAVWELLTTIRKAQKKCEIAARTVHICLLTPEQMGKCPLYLIQIHWQDLEIMHMLSPIYSTSFQTTFSNTQNNLDGLFSVKYADDNIRPSQRNAWIEYCSLRNFQLRMAETGIKLHTKMTKNHAGWLGLQSKTGYISIGFQKKLSRYFV